MHLPIGVESATEAVGKNFDEYFAEFVGHIIINNSAEPDEVNQPHLGCEFETRVRNAA